MNFTGHDNNKCKKEPNNWKLEYEEKTGPAFQQITLLKDRYAFPLGKAIMINLTFVFVAVLTIGFPEDAELLLQ